MSTVCPTSHDLLRYAVEGPSDDLAVVVEHVRVCESCRAITEEFRSRSAAVDQIKTSGGSHTVTRTSGGERADESRVPDVVGNVAVLEPIGYGGMGVVHRGRDRMLGRDVAVKFLLRAVAGENDPRFEEFLQGARNAAKLRHANLVTLHQALLVEQIPCLVMEYVDGPTLGDILRRQERLRAAAAVRITLDVANAVAALHEHGTIHRDIKPSNVLFSRQGHLYVTDFGLACPRPRATGDDAPQHRVAGTPAYMAPEMFDGEVSTRTDVYALGITLYELLCGQRPFSGAPDELRERHKNQPALVEPLAAAKVPEALIEIIERALHKNDIFRFKSAREFARALERCGVEPAVERDVLELVEKASSSGSSTDETKVEAGSSGSYFQRLTQLASARSSVRGEPGSDAVTLTPSFETSSHSGSTESPSRPTICAWCQCDLRGREFNERCPECDRPWAESSPVKPLAEWSSEQVRQLHRGAGFIRAGFLALAIGFMALTVVLAVGSSFASRMNGGLFGWKTVWEGLNYGISIGIMILLGHGLTRIRSQGRTSVFPLSGGLLPWPVWWTIMALTGGWGAVGLACRLRGLSPSMVGNPSIAVRVGLILCAWLSLNALAAFCRAMGDSKPAESLRVAALLAPTAAMMLSLAEWFRPDAHGSTAIGAYHLGTVIIGTAAVGAMLWSAGLIGRVKAALAKKLANPR